MPSAERGMDLESQSPRQHRFVRQVGAEVALPNPGSERNLDVEEGSEIGAQATRESMRSFPNAATSTVEPYRTNGVYKFLTLLGLFMAPFYLFYLWSNRRSNIKSFSSIFFVGEIINFVLSLLSRLLLWHRQQRHMCRLDALSPPFPREQWPRVHIWCCHYTEPPADLVDTLRQSVQLDYPPASYVVTILDDGFYKRKGEVYEKTQIGQQMEDMIGETLAAFTQLGHAGIKKTWREVCPDERNRSYRHEVAPGGSSIIEFQVEGLPLVRFVCRKKGPDSFSKTGNLENALWNIMEDDVNFMVLVDADMAPRSDMLQLLLPTMLQYRDSEWKPDWRTAFASSPQDFKNIEHVWGASDPMNQQNKFFWQILPTALDSFGFVHFWGTNVVFFVPALKDVTGFVYACISEDTATGAQLHRLGWSSSFVGGASLTLFKGLCRENVQDTFHQRKRWCQGNIQHCLMELDPPLVLADSFRYPPYRHELWRRLQDVKDQDRSDRAPEPISPEDVGAESRRSRRSWRWKVLREVAYFPCKHAFWYHLQPIYYYSIALAILYMGQPPFLVDSRPIVNPLDFFSRFHVVLAYWLANSLANFFGYSYILDDPNNPNSPLWRAQQEYWGYAWIRLVGLFEGLLSARTGKQPSWAMVGTAGRFNVLYELPNAVAFVTMALSMAVVVANYCIAARFGYGSELLPGPSTVKAAELVGCLFAGFCVLFLMWPVTSCIFVDLLRIPHYYRLGSVVPTLLAATLQVGIGFALFNAAPRVSK
mmetsp:Transcript_25760/g.65473  ORF Transcript_25760/g.65473 Transcript_25760/m.65473 type:complete len:762 (+) Transcript_25760:59-2344(+)